MSQTVPPVRRVERIELHNRVLAVIGMQFRLPWNSRS